MPFILTKMTPIKAFTIIADDGDIEGLIRVSAEELADLRLAAEIRDRAIQIFDGLLSHLEERKTE